MSWEKRKERDGGEKRKEEKSGLYYGREEWVEISPFNWDAQIAKARLHYRRQVAIRQSASISSVD